MHSQAPSYCSILHSIVSAEALPSGGCSPEMPLKVQSRLPECSSCLSVCNHAVRAASTKCHPSSNAAGLMKRNNSATKPWRVALGILELRPSRPEICCSCAHDIRACHVVSRSRYDKGHGYGTVCLPGLFDHPTGIEALPLLGPRWCRAPFTLSFGQLGKPRPQISLRIAVLRPGIT